MIKFIAGECNYLVFPLTLFIDQVKAIFPPTHLQEYIVL